MSEIIESFYRYTINTLRRTVHWSADRCTGCLLCYEVCPVGCCLPDPQRNKIAPPDQERCVVCEACVLQCPEDALWLA